jgi:hypothetical protein
MHPELCWGAPVLGPSWLDDLTVSTILFRRAAPKIQSFLNHGHLKNQDGVV